MTDDRASAAMTCGLTHEFVAIMLGVRLD